MLKLTKLNGWHARVHISSLTTTLLEGFSSGLPLALVTTTLQAWYSEAGISLIALSWLSLTQQPYAFKFLWAWLFDKYSLPGFTHRRGWIISMQISLICILLLMSTFDPKLHPIGLGCLGLAAAVLSATQDLNIDAYRTELLDKATLANGVTIYIIGFRIGLLLSGSGALIMADRFGWSSTYKVMALLMLIGLITSFYSRETKPKQKNASSQPDIKVAIYELFKKPYIVSYILFIFLYELGDSLVGSLFPIYLLREMAYSLTDVGLLLKTTNLVALLLSAAIASVILKRYQLWLCLCIFGLGEAISLSFLKIASTSHYLLLAVNTSLGIFEGLCGIAIIMLFSKLCNGKHTAFHYSFLSAVSASKGMIGGPIAAWLVKKYSWSFLFHLGFIVSMPALILLLVIAQLIKSQSMVNSLQDANNNNGAILNPSLGSKLNSTKDLAV